MRSTGSSSTSGRSCVSRGSSWRAGAGTARSRSPASSPARGSRRSGSSSAGDDPLPMAWSEEFEAEWGRTAPRSWIDPAARQPLHVLAHSGEDLVRALERSLGRVFPTVDDP